MTQVARRKWGTWQLIALNTGFSLGLLLIGITFAQAGMYRWVDSNGRVQYSDTLPVTYQKSGAAELSKQGLVVKRTASAAERETDAANRVEQARLKRIADEQARIDRALTSTYTSEAEIDLARDRALAHHQSAIEGARIRAKAVRDNQKELQIRVKSATGPKNRIPANLRLQVAQNEKETQDLKRTILQNMEAMVQVRKKYEADKQRFKTLVAGTP